MGQGDTLHALLPLLIQANSQCAWRVFTCLLLYKHYMLTWFRVGGLTHGIQYDCTHSGIIVLSIKSASRQHLIHYKREYTIHRTWRRPLMAYVKQHLYTCIYTDKCIPTVHIIRLEWTRDFVSWATHIYKMHSQCMHKQVFLLGL